MAKRTIKSENEWTDYLQFVISNARHHAPNAIEAVPRIITALQFINPAIKKVFDREGDIKRWMWFIPKSGIEYALVYDYSSETINLRIGRKILKKFDNNSSFEEILIEFQKL
jgi:hypothetical protein